MAQVLLSCLQLLPGQMEACLAAGLHSKFKLLSKISCGVSCLCHISDVRAHPCSYMPKLPCKPSL